MENNGEFVDKAVKEAEIPQKVIPVPIPPPFSQRLVKNTEDDKYRCSITMLKQLSINVPLIQSFEKCPVMPSL